MMNEMVESEMDSDEFDFTTDDRIEDEYPFGIPHDVLMELIGKDNE